MLFCKVIAGDCCLGSYALKTPPTIAGSTKQYDTFVDKMTNPSIFVVTRDFMAIPLWKVWFTTPSD